LYKIDVEYQDNYILDASDPEDFGALEGIWRLRKVLSGQMFYNVVSWILITRH
jgi:hypothetical protein